VAKQQKSSKDDATKSTTAAVADSKEGVRKGRSRRMPQRLPKQQLHRQSMAVERSRFLRI